MTTATNWNGMDYTILLSGEGSPQSIGAFASLDDAGKGPPRHIHHDADESFYILAGEVEFWVAGETRYAKAGEMLMVPKGTEHCFRIIGDTPARMLTIMTPGGFEQFFVEVASENLRIPQDMVRISEIGVKYDLEFTGSPLGVAAE